MARESAQTVRPYPGELERTYRRVFDRFARMIADGVFPFAVDAPEVLTYTPRVGDGVVVIDDQRQVEVRLAQRHERAEPGSGVAGSLGGRDVGELGLDGVGLDLAMARGARRRASWRWTRSRWRSV